MSLFLASMSPSLESLTKASSSSLLRGGGSISLAPT